MKKKSPKRDAHFQKLKLDLPPESASIRVLCPTRWTVWTAALQSVLDNYETLLTLWEEVKESPLDSEIKARIIGVEAQMNDFNFLFGVSLGALVLNHRDNLSKALQKSSMSASEGQLLAKLALDVLKLTSSPFSIKEFCLYQKRSNPSLPRKRAPKQYDIGSSI
jgi:hypothetical protein